TIARASGARGPERQDEGPSGSDEAMTQAARDAAAHPELRGAEQPDRARFARAMARSRCVDGDESREVVVCRAERATRGPRPACRGDDRVFVARQDAKDLATAKRQGASLRSDQPRVRG